MGAMRWQVVHQKAKNSTSCGLPAASVTVDGSVASRFGRGTRVSVGAASALASVATTSVVAASVAAAGAVAATATSSVDTLVAASVGAASATSVGAATVFSTPCAGGPEQAAASSSASSN